MEKEQRFPTYIKEIDIKIGIDIDDHKLVNLCRLNKYINSICPIIWEEKLKLLYPDLPIPNRNRAREEYFAIYHSYVKLKEFADKYGYDDILDWLHLPENDINYLIEYKAKRGKDGIKNLGEAARYTMKQARKLDEYLEQGFEPEQKSVDICFLVGNELYAKILAEYGFLPSPGVIDDAIINGYYYPSLSNGGIFPSQNAINIAAKKGKIAIRNLFEYGIYPDQDAINITAENGYDDLIYYLGSANMFPDQRSIDIAEERGFYGIAAVLDQLELEREYRK